MQPRFQSYQLAYQLSEEGKAHNQDYNINAEAKDEVEMQTPIDNSNIFTEVSRCAQAFP
jgi:hypothetical protein